MSQSIGRPHSNVGMIGFTGGMPVSGGYAGTGAAPSWVSQGNGFSLPDFVQTGFAPGQSSFFNPGGAVSNQGLGRFDSGQQTPQQLMQNSGTWHASPANAEWSPTQVRPTQSGNMPFYQGAWGNAAQQANGMNSGVQQQAWTPQLGDANASGSQPMRPSGANAPGFEQTWRPGPNGTEGQYASGTNTMNFQNGGFAPSGSGVTGGTFLHQNNNRTQGGSQPGGRQSSTVTQPNRTLLSNRQPRDIPGTAAYAGVLRDEYGNEAQASRDAWSNLGSQRGTPNAATFLASDEAIRLGQNVMPGGTSASHDYYTNLARMAGRAGGEGEPPGATAIRNLPQNAGMPIQTMPFAGNAVGDFGMAESFLPQDSSMTPYGSSAPNRPIQGQQPQPTGYSGYNFTGAPPPRPTYGGGSSGGNMWSSGNSGQGYGNYVGPPQSGSSGSSGGGYPGMIGPPLQGPGPTPGSGTSVGIGTQNGGSPTVTQGGFGGGMVGPPLSGGASGTALTRGGQAPRQPGWQFQFMQNGTLPQGYAMSRPRPGTVSPSPITGAARPGMSIAPQGNTPYTPRQNPPSYATRPQEGQFVGPPQSGYGQGQGGSQQGSQYQYGGSNSSSYTTTQRMPTQTYVNSSRQQYRY